MGFVDDKKYTEYHQIYSLMSAGRKSRRHIWLHLIFTVCSMDVIFLKETSKIARFISKLKLSKDRFLYLKGETLESF